MLPFSYKLFYFFNKTLQPFIRCENLHDFSLSAKLTSKVNKVPFTYACFIISRVNSGWTLIENMEKQIRKIAQLEQTQLLFTWDEDWRKPNNFLEKQIFEGNPSITSYLTKCLFSFWFSIWCHQSHFLRNSVSIPRMPQKSRKITTILFIYITSPKLRSSQISLFL